MFGWFTKTQPSILEDAANTLSSLLSAAYETLRYPPDSEALSQLRHLSSILWEAQTALEHIERSLQCSSDDLPRH